MQKYDVRKGLEGNIEMARLKELVSQSFGGSSEEQGKVTASFGALAKFIAWGEDKSLCVETLMRTDVPNEVAAETIKRYNSFLERATGFNSKERKKRLEAKAKKGKLQ